VLNPSTSAYFSLQPLTSVVTTTFYSQVAEFSPEIQYPNAYNHYQLIFGIPFTFLPQFK
jgi:hypothetical protein